MQIEKPLFQPSVANLFARLGMLILFWAAFSCMAYAQSDGATANFGAYNIEFDYADDPYYNDSTISLDLKLKAIQGGQRYKLGRGEIKVYEIVDGEKLEYDVTNVINKVEESQEINITEQYNVLLLADISKNIDQAEIDKGKEIIKQIVSDISLPSGSKYLFSTFGDEVSDLKELNSSNVNEVLRDYAPTADASDLYGAVFRQVRKLRDFEGKKVLILLSDGNHSTPQIPYYNTHLPYEEEEVLKLFEQLSFELSVFSIGLGSQINEPFLSALVKTTSNASDSYSQGVLPDNLKENLFSGAQLKSNNIAQLFPPSGRNIFTGESRKLKVIWVETDSVEVNFSLGSIQIPIEIKSGGISATTWTVYFLIGALFVALLFMAFSLAVPVITRQNFKRKYVQPYKRIPGVTKRDPLTNEPFEEGELVVVKCTQVTSLSTWDGLGGQCPNYPDCLDFVNPCNGAGAPTGNENFFSMKGVLGKLNWLWFGSLGGFIAWSLFAITQVLNLSWYKDLMKGITELGFVSSSFDKSINVSSLEVLSNETLLGIAFGTGISFALAWVEERGQPRKISWFRIFLRTVIGMVVSFVVFVIGFYIQYTGLLPFNWLNALLTWLLLGIALGLVLSIKSSVSPKRGVMGGILASAIAFGVYFFLSTFTQEYSLTKLFSFIIMGGVLGYTLVTIIATLEDFEMEYLTPEKFQGTNPISKWLKSGVDVTIGREPGCYVYVKWEDDAVLPHHAVLTFEKGVVFMEPIGETLVNGRMLSKGKKTALKDGDLIQLGRDSITKMRYKEKRK